MSEEPKLFKDHFTRKTAVVLATQIKSAWAQFDEDRFVAACTNGLKAMELLARVEHFSKALAQTLPEDFIESLAILQRSLPPPLLDCEKLSVGWAQWPIAHYVSAHGTQHPAEALAFLAEFTQRFSAEFAVRVFAERHPEKTFAFLYSLLEHPNPHVRRWCSEGVRPRLPWGGHLQALIQDPTPVWPILEALKDDPERYVRRSVANHLNDIAKDHPELVLARCKVWARGQSASRKQLIQHALRTLIKAGHPEALAQIGYRPPANITATLQCDQASLVLGQTLTLEASLHSAASSPQALLLDYVVHFVRKDGSTGAKTFKWTQLTLKAGAQQVLLKKHPFKPITTRSYYSGAHRIELQLNGKIVAANTVTLKADAGAKPR